MKDLKWKGYDQFSAGLTCRSPRLSMTCQYCRRPSQTRGEEGGWAERQGQDLRVNKGGWRQGGARQRWRSQRFRWTNLRRELMKLNGSFGSFGSTEFSWIHLARLGRPGDGDNLRVETEEANIRAEEATMRVKQLEHELALKEQENIGLVHKNELLELEIERLEQQLMEAKTAAEDDSGNRNMNESLQKKIQMLEEELEMSDMNLRKTTEKLRQVDVKSEHFERKVCALEKERDDIEARYEEMMKKYEHIKAELEEVNQQLESL
ncbi:hypothetical protein PCK1_000925 [Pneumocystis canis]|nr:hypothetical protein PCK1_000925 [Pneumocystis canis]